MHLVKTSNALIQSGTGGSVRKQHIQKQAPIDHELLPAGFWAVYATRDQMAPGRLSSETPNSTKGIITPGSSKSGRLVRPIPPFRNFQIALNHYIVILQHAGGFFQFENEKSI
jgi:hypothetical protein